MINKLRSEWLIHSSYQRDVRSVFRWMRWDIPLRVMPMTIIPIGLVMLSFQSADDLGLVIVNHNSWWLITAVLIVPVFSTAFLFSLRYISGYGFSKGALALELPFYLILNPIAEEVFFRGLLLHLLNDYFGIGVSVAIVSVIFGFHHWIAGFSMKFLLLATIGGLVFGVVAMLSGSILPAIILHSVADLGLFVFGPLYSRRGKPL